MNKSESIAKLAEALSKAQGQIKGAVKDSANPYFKSKYADLASCWDACRVALSDNGLSVVQIPEWREGFPVIVTILLHSSGEWISGELLMAPVKDDPQGIGSAITYARRYALSAFVGIAPEDDDANAASGKDLPERAYAPRTFGKAIEPLLETTEALETSIEFINVGQQKNFHKKFNETFDEFNPDLKGKGNDYCYQWLKEKGFLDENKLPSAAGIPASGWFQTRDDALAYAKSLKVRQ